MKVMPEWKIQIKQLADDFYVSQTKVNKMLKNVEQQCLQREMPSFYKGNQDEYLYDNAQRELMKMIYA